MLTFNCRLSATDGQYRDAKDVKVLTQDFGNMSSLDDMSDIIPHDAKDDINLYDYFKNRGYIADVNIRAAPYDWRFGPGTIKRLCSIIDL